MTVVSTEITNIRYDLRDEDKTQYSDALLLHYFNRAVEALASFLGSIRSDWVFTDTTLTLASAASTTSLPSDFGTDILVQIDDEDLGKKSVDTIKELLQETTAGTPEYYGIHKQNLAFEKTASAELSVYFQYNQKHTTLATTGSDMPYNDEFNASLRSAVVMMAKNRNERNIISEYALHDFYRGAILSKVIGRTVYKPIKTFDY